MLWATAEVGVGGCHEAGTTGRDAGGPTSRGAVWLPILLLCAAGAAAQPPAGPPKDPAEDRPRGPCSLSPDEVSALETQLAATPADLDRRARLLRHYMGDWTPAGRAARADHVLWIVAKVPEAEVAGRPETHLDRTLDGEAFERARSLWLAHVEAGGSNPKIVRHAARFFLLAEPARARDLLQRGRELEPSNPDWSEELARLDMLAARRPGPEARDSARRALEEFEAALALVEDGRKRYYSLADVAEAARLSGADEKARRYADELLRQAESLPRDWNYGNAVHEGHRILGHLELDAGNVEAAKSHFLEAGASPGSPQLDSFGPELTLASALLAKGERGAVIEYLQRISRFWKGREDALESWIILIRGGKSPELDRFRARRSPGRGDEESAGGFPEPSVLE